MRNSSIASVTSCEAQHAPRIISFSFIPYLSIVGALSTAYVYECKDTKFLARLQVFRQLFFDYFPNVKIGLYQRHFLRAIKRAILRDDVRDPWEILERLGRNSNHLSIPSNPLYTAVSRDSLRDERFFDETFQKRIHQASKSAFAGRKNIPSKGTNHSHVGNAPFPIRERFIPLSGTHERQGVQAHL